MSNRSIARVILVAIAIVAVLYFLYLIRNVLWLLFIAVFLAIALGPYRRGDVWAWWALSAGTLVVSVLILLRILFLGIQLGAPAAVIQLVVVGLGLAVGAGRLRRSNPPA